MSSTQVLLAVAQYWSAHGANRVHALLQHEVHALLTDLPIENEATEYIEVIRLEKAVYIDTQQSIDKRSRNYDTDARPILQQNDRHTSRTHLAVESIRSLIFSGDLAAGTDHLEHELADRLSMSRTPIREAARVLEAQGLLEVRPRKGVRILILSAGDMNEIYTVLTELESLAASLVARGGYDKEQLQVLFAAVLDMESSLKHNDRESWAEADGRFHDELVRLAGNTRMAAIISNFNDQVRRARAFTLNLRPLPLQSNKEHRALYEAITRGDGQAARKIHWDHRESARRMLVGILEDVGVKHL